MKRAALAAAAVIALMVVVPAPARADEGPFPIWWSPKFELSAREEVPQRLRREFRREYWKVAYKSAPRSRALGRNQQRFAFAADQPPLAKTVVDSCESLNTANRRGYWINHRVHSITGTDRHGMAEFEALGIECALLQLLSSGQAASRSFLRDFHFSADVLQVLPEILRFYVRCDSICDVFELDENVTPWGCVDEDCIVDVMSKDNMAILSEDFAAGFEIVARGDFDGDGLDDIAIERRLFPTWTPVGVRHLYVMTRDAPDSVLRVLLLASPLDWKIGCDCGNP